MCATVGVCAPLLVTGRIGDEFLDEALLPASLPEALLLERVRRRPKSDFEVSDAGGLLEIFSSLSNALSLGSKGDPRDAVMIIMIKIILESKNSHYINTKSYMEQMNRNSKIHLYSKRSDYH